MALDEFFTMYHGFQEIFENFRKCPAPTHFLPPLYPNFEFSCLQHKTVIMYMLFNGLGIALVVTNTLKKMTEIE